MIRELAAGAIFFGMLRGPGCGEVDSPENGANAPCTRDGDCASGLVCADGVCGPRAEDAASEASTIGDATVDSADAAGDDG